MLFRSYGQVSLLALWVGGGGQRAVADLQAWAAQEESFLANIAGYADSQAEAVAILSGIARDRGSERPAASAEPFLAGGSAASSSEEGQPPAGAAKASAAEVTAPYAELQPAPGPAPAGSAGGGQPRQSSWARTTLRPSSARGARSTCGGARKPGKLRLSRRQPRLHLPAPQALRAWPARRQSRPRDPSQRPAFLQNLGQPPQLGQPPKLRQPVRG